MKRISNDSVMIQITVGILLQIFVGKSFEHRGVMQGYRSLFVARVGEKKSTLELLVQEMPTYVLEF